MRRSKCHVYEVPTLIAMVTIVQVVSGQTSPGRPTSGGSNDSFVQSLQGLGERSQLFRIQENAELATSDNSDATRLETAMENSVAWIRAVLKPEHIPDDLESMSEAWVGGRLGPSMQGRPGDGQKEPWDCILTNFQRDGRRFVIVQDSVAVHFLVAPIHSAPTTQAPLPEELARNLREDCDRMIRHSAIPFYLGAIHNVDNAVELVSPELVWISSENRWNAKVIVPPPVWKEGRSLANGLPDGVLIVDRLRELDPTLRDPGRYALAWWSKVHASTNGSWLVYGVMKLGGGSRVLSQIPDWFRLSNAATSNSEPGDGDLPRATGAFLPSD